MRFFSTQVNAKTLAAIVTILFAATVMMTGCGDDGTTSTSPGPAAGAPGPAASPTDIAPTSVTISIPAGAATRTTDAFGVNPQVVPVGSIVTWVNNDTVPHTTTSTTGVWDSEQINPGQSFSFTFNTAGTFPYFCEIHPGMRGTIQVTGTTRPTGSPAGSPQGSPQGSPRPSSSPQGSPRPSSSPNASPSGDDHGGGGNSGRG